jgi:AcrR family transcriptional regulator
MFPMSTPYEQQGRTKQKQRTRYALVAAAQDLVARGLTPTVEDAAVDADVSRATAYRYFPNQAALLAAAHPETAKSSLLPTNPPDDPDARVALVVAAFTKLIVDTESQQRTMLRLSLATDDERRSSLPLRQGRAIAWLTEALEPARALLGDDGVHTTAVAIRSAIGIEALIWLTDIAELSRRRAVELMRSNARAICRAALAEAADSPRN